MTKNGEIHKKKNLKSFPNFEDRGATYSRGKSFAASALRASLAPLCMINVKLIKTCLSPSETVYSSSSRDIPKSDILTVFFSPTRQFLAAKSRWMQFFDSKYCIPAAASKHIPKEEINR